MAFDYKKEYKEFYMPKNKPSIVTVPDMNFIAVRGQGDPNAEDGEYKQSIGLLYGIAFTIKTVSYTHLNVGVADTPRLSEPLSFFEKTLFSSAPTGVSHRSFTVEHVYSFRSVLRTSGH